MKLPRNARIFQGQLDVAPFACVFFLLLMFLLLNTSLVYTPGVRIDLPEVDASLPGVRGLTTIVAIDANDRLYYESQQIDESQLLVQLKKEVARAGGQPLTLIIHADSSSRNAPFARVSNLAHEAGVAQVLMSVRSRHERHPPAPVSNHAILPAS